MASMLDLACSRTAEGAILPDIPAANMPKFLLTNASLMLCAKNNRVQMGNISLNVAKARPSGVKAGIVVTF